MSERRFTEKPELDPQAVLSLADDHPAMVENRTLFPSTVVTITADEPDRILVSGRNNRKIGATVEKGKFKGYGIYCLSLEERATCPTDCSARGFCYGNGMQLARRHRIPEDADIFYDRLGFEIAELLDQHPGLLIRLHVLGDFPSAEYVAFWKDVLDEYPNVACFGYTHRAPQSWGGDEIGDAIEVVKDVYPDRFRIRWSSDVSRADGAIVIDYVPDGPKTDNREIVCPSQTDATACCATCALCWEQATKRDCIAFVKHGRTSDAVTAAAAMSAMATPDFEKMVMAAMPKLKSFAMSLTKNRDASEDLVQDTVVKALSKREQFEPGTNLAAWLTTILRNECYSQMRKSGRETDDPEGYLTDRLVSAEDPGSAMEAKEGLAALETLPENQREVLRDAGMGLSIQQMAEKHGVPEGTIKSRISRGRDALAEAMETRAVKPLPVLQIVSPTPMPEPTGDQRRVAPIKLPTVKPGNVASTDYPDIRHVAPTDLIVEASYQRDLSGKSIGLIKKIVAVWDWAKFKPPVCAESPAGLFVIDGQHTAIAAASHPHVLKIPVMVVRRAEVASRADAFVSQNTNRLAMSQLQIFHAEVVAGKKDAINILKCTIRAGATIPKSIPPKGKEKVGEVVSMSALRIVWSSGKPDHFERVLRLAVMSGKTPVNSLLIRGIDLSLKRPADGSSAPIAAFDDSGLALAISRIDIEEQSAEVAVNCECSKYQALSSLIEIYAWDVTEEEGNAPTALAS